MGKAYRLGLIIVLLAVGAAAAILYFSSNDSGSKGVEACTIYKDSVEEAPEAIAPAVELAKIKGMLKDLDDPTRRAFAELITAADANPFEADQAAVPEAAAEVRSTCLAEHDVEIVS